MVPQTLKPVATVDLAARPLRAYRDLLKGVVAVRQLSALDAYIVTLLLEFLPGPLALTDLTAPRPRSRVWRWLMSASLAC